MKQYLKIVASALVICTATFVSCDKGDEKVTYTVNFDADGGTPIPSVQNVEAGGTATAPSPNPTKSGYVFLFWRLNGVSTAYNFGAPVNNNITLQAKWEEEAKVEYWQVAWELNGGSWPSGDNHTTQVVKGGTLAEPVAPTKAGSTFDGWYKEATLGNKIIFPYDVNAVTANFTLYAKWKTEGGGDVSKRGEGLYIGNGTTPVNLNSYSGNFISKAAQYYSGNPPAEYTLILEHDFEMEGSLNFSKNGSTITITGKGGVRTITRSGSNVDNAVFEIGNGNTIIFGENITLAGNTKALDVRGMAVMKSGSSITVSAKNRAAVTVSVGKFVMEGGIIKGNTSTTGNGGGVWIQFGEFIMEGGVIENCVSSTFGGGVYISGDDGKFTMKDGIIRNNYAAAGGGVCIWGGGNFVMEGGKIQNNTALNGTALGVAVTGDGRGGGVYLGNNPGAEKKPEFVMSGGTIYGTSDILEANNAQYEGKALYRKDGTAKYGNGVAIQSTAVNTTLKGVK